MPRALAHASLSAHKEQAGRCIVSVLTVSLHGSAIGLLESGVWSLSGHEFGNVYGC